jgi:hypothetical protein
LTDSEFCPGSGRHRSSGWRVTPDVMPDFGLKGSG